MTNIYFAALFAVILGLVVGGRIIGDRSARRLDDQNKAKLISTLSLYWTLPTVATSVIAYFLFLADYSFVWTFLVASFLNFAYGIFIVPFRRAVLLREGFPNNFVSLRTIAVSLQFLGTSLLPLGIFAIVKQLLGS